MEQIIIAPIIMEGYYGGMEGSAGWRGCFIRRYLGFSLFQRSFGLLVPFGMSVVGHNFFGCSAISFRSGTERSKYYSLDTPLII